MASSNKSFHSGWKICVIQRDRKRERKRRIKTGCFTVKHDDHSGHVDVSSSIEISLHHRLRPVFPTHRLHPNTHTALLYSTQKGVSHNLWSIWIHSRHFTVVEWYPDDRLHTRCTRTSSNGQVVGTDLTLMSIEYLNSAKGFTWAGWVHSSL